MDESQLIETFGAVWDCPIEGCGFIFTFEICRSEDEARAILMQISRLHGRQCHGDEAFFDPKIYVVVTTPYPAGERRPLDN